MGTGAEPALESETDRPRHGTSGRFANAPELANPAPRPSVPSETGSAGSSGPAIYNCPNHRRRHPLAARPRAVPSNCFYANVNGPVEEIQGRGLHGLSFSQRHTSYEVAIVIWKTAQHLGLGHRRKEGWRSNTREGPHRASFHVDMS